MNRERLPHGPLLMCPPDFYEVEYEINAWMHKDSPSDTERARLQWIELMNTLVRHGAYVTLIQPRKHPDMVFTANAGLMIERGVVVPSHFRHPERQGEERYWRAWFRRKGYEILELPKNIHFEGAGDALWVGGTLVAGHGFRSDREAYPAISRLMNHDDVIEVKLVDERFYHLDTCFCPLDACDVLVFPGAFDAESLRTLKRSFTCMAVPEEEALNFACNAVVLGKTVVLPAGCPKTRRLLRRKGYEPVSVALDEFMKAGGAARCLTLDLLG